MASVTIRLEVDRVTRRRTVVVGYASDEDALPVEHEEAHRAIVRRLIEGGVISEDEGARVRVCREATGEVAEAVAPGTPAEHAVARAREEKQ